LRLSKVALLLATAGQLEQKDILKSCITLPLIQWNSKETEDNVEKDDKLKDI